MHQMLQYMYIFWSTYIFSSQADFDLFVNIFEISSEFDFCLRDEYRLMSCVAILSVQPMYGQQQRISVKYQLFTWCGMSCWILRNLYTCRNMDTSTCYIRNMRTQSLLPWLQLDISQTDTQNKIYSYNTHAKK